MAQAAKAMRYFHKNKPSLFRDSIEKLAYAAGLIGPLVTLPQLLKVWVTHNASGLSLITWASYCVIAVIMVAYGVMHKEKPIIIMYCSFGVVDALIIAGAILYGHA